jgi:DNA-binding NarL/FixJ family response regulator
MPIHSRPRVLIGEDHPATARLLQTLLATDFEVVAWVSDGAALVAAATRLAPDAIVTDIAMPGLDGITAATEVRSRDAGARIVFVTVHAEPDMVEAGLSTGALGYVLKDTAGDDLVAAVHAALQGKRYVSRELADVAADLDRLP